jgi:thiol-disulfide isomerase/thioredoxin
VTSPPKPRKTWRQRLLRGLGELAIVAAIFFAVQAWITRDAASGSAPSLAGAPEGVTAVHFWATWCGVCRAEEGNVEALAEHYDIVTVATRSVSPAEVDAYRQAHELDAPVLVDSSGEMAAQWGVRSFPTTFFLNRDGTIDSVTVGYTTTVGMWVRAWFADR